MATYNGDPTEYVQENRDLLVHLLMHGDDPFVRALAIAALIEYGNQVDIEDVQRELERARAGRGGSA